jgi:fructokinase
MKPALMVGLGEVLWDKLPSGKVLGGAPANFACMISALGDRGVIASRIGLDPLGEEASAAISKFGVDAQYLQRDQEYETGSAEIAIDEIGQPIFTIKECVSWDNLEWTSSWEDLARLADVICFGTLAQRCAVSAATVDSFLRNSRSDTIRIFDVNLRQSYYSTDVLKRSLHRANIVKLTDQELTRVTTMIGLEAKEDESRAKRLLDAFNLRLVCITRGANGSVLVTREKTVVHPGFAVHVVDAIGAGDAFTACLAHYLVQGRSLEEINEFANRLASWVVTQAGATPSVDRRQLQKIMSGVSRKTVQLDHYSGVLPRPPEKKHDV